MQPVTRERCTHGLTSGSSGLRRVSRRLQGYRRRRRATLRLRRLATPLGASEFSLGKAGLMCAWVMLAGSPLQGVEFLGAGWEQSGWTALMLG